MISFEPTEDQQLILSTVSDFAKTTLAPRAREFEKLKAVPDEVLRSVHEMGLAAAPIPESLGGQGLVLLTAVMINEELGYGSADAAYGLPGFGAFFLAAMELGTDEQAKALIAPYLADAAWNRNGAVAWSEKKPNTDYAGFRTTAKKTADGWELTGGKAFVGNANNADTFIVFAQIDPNAGWNGIGAFIVKKDNPGLRVGERHQTLGLNCASFGELT